jgi:hypothetical protein
MRCSTPATSTTTKLVLNTEIEVEHAADDQEGEVAVEFAYLDYLYSPAFNLRGGLVLVPMGLLSEMHEPTTFLSARRPDSESRIIPSTWRENGVGAFGDVGPFSYKLYLVNGFDAEGFSAAGLRGGRQKASKANADDLAVVGRVDFTGVPGLLAGVSCYQGDSGAGTGGSVIHPSMRRMPTGNGAAWKCARWLWWRRWTARAS